MDRIHDVAKKPWISKRIIKFGSVIKARQQQLLDENVFLQETNIADVDLLKALHDFTKSNHESLDQQFLFNTSDERTLVVDSECNHLTYKLQLEHSRKLLTSRVYRVEYLSRLKLTRRELLMRHLASTNEPHGNVDLITSSNQNVQNFVPLLTIQMWPQPGSETKVRLEKEIIFRADNLLIDLRNQFKCQLDYGVPIELSDDPDKTERISRGELFKSGFLLINDTFYNDMRDRNNVDLSVAIREWAAKTVLRLNEFGDNEIVSKGLGPFKTALMEETKMEDIEFRLGCPYLFLHQGNCEHLFTISDIKYVPDDESMSKLEYPLITATSISRKNDLLKCYMCKDRPPHWYVRSNDRLPLDPFFFCEDCFYSFNYDSDKKKIGQFKAYLYTSTLGIPNSVVMRLNHEEH